MSHFEQFDGWLLDITTCSEGVILWVKKGEKILEIFQEFHPEFFAVPKKNIGSDFKRLKSIIETHPNVKNVRVCKKYVKLEDHEKATVFGVSVSKPSEFRVIIKEIDEIGHFTLYNTDLPISQMYFYVNNLFPMSFCNLKVKIEKDRKNNSKKLHLVSLELKDNNEELFYDLPPLKAVWLDVRVQQKGIRKYYNEPLAYVEISIVEKDERNNIPRADGLRKKKIIIDEADETETLRTVSRVIETLNPDIILTQGGDEFIFPYLAARASINHVSNELYFSRTKTPLFFANFFNATRLSEIPFALAGIIS